MSTISEKQHALLWGEKFLCDIADGTIKRIPKSTRDLAHRILRHFPVKSELKQLRGFFGESVDAFLNS